MQGIIEIEEILKAMLPCLSVIERQNRQRQEAKPLPGAKGRCNGGEAQKDTAHAKGQKPLPYFLANTGKERQQGAKEPVAHREAVKAAEQMAGDEGKRHATDKEDNHPLVRKRFFIKKEKEGG